MKKGDDGRQYLLSDAPQGPENRRTGGSEYPKIILKGAEFSDTIPQEFPSARGGGAAGARGGTLG